MDAEVSRTLAELERKLHELERVLAVEAGRQEHPAASAHHGGAGGEATQYPGTAAEGAASQEGQPEGTGAEGAASQGGAPQGTGAEGAATPERRPQARLVDEDAERSQPFPPPRTQQESPHATGAPLAEPTTSAAHPIAGQWPPSPPAGLRRHASEQEPGSSRGAQEAADASLPTQDSIELAQLVRFRDRLERTLQELVEEYAAIITLRKTLSGSDEDQPSRSQQHQPSQHPDPSGY